MIKKFSDIVFDNETLKLVNKTIQNQADFQRACNSPKYLVIDWRDVKIADLQLLGLDLEELSEYCGWPEHINNIEILGHFIQLTDKKDPETLWIMLVDDQHHISHELYCQNTFAENMAILAKMTKFKLPLI